MKTLLIINRKQFGYHTDSYEIAIKLRGEFQITYLCYDFGFSKFSCDGVNVVYVSSDGNYLSRSFRFFKQCLDLSKINFDHYFLIYWRFSSLIKLLSGKPFILDFRTGSVHKSVIRRSIDDFLMRVEAMFFKRITVISEGLKENLNIPDNKTFILPLGANVLSNTSKDFNNLWLFYIGTFYNRNIEETVIGLAEFLDQNPEYWKITQYHIVGSGYRNEENIIRYQIRQHGLDKIVILHGRRNHEEIRHLFDQCNVGVSFVPITNYFNHQPPTKTFEYILAGMPCIATATSENKKYINDINGVLCIDSASSFSDGLKNLVLNFGEYDSSKIRQSLSEFTWDKIADNFKDYLLNGE